LRLAGSTTSPKIIILRRTLCRRNLTNFSSAHTCSRGRCSLEFSMMIERAVVSAQLVGYFLLYVMEPPAARRRTRNPLFSAPISRARERFFLAQIFLKKRGFLQPRLSLIFCRRNLGDRRTKRQQSSELLSFRKMEGAVVSALLLGNFCFTAWNLLQQGATPMICLFLALGNVVFLGLFLKKQSFLLSPGSINQQTYRTA
jgi:hypothetical protein